MKLRFHWMSNWLWYIATWMACQIKFLCLNWLFHSKVQPKYSHNSLHTTSLIGFWNFIYHIVNIATVSYPYWNIIKNSRKKKRSKKKISITHLSFDFVRLWAFNIQNMRSKSQNFMKRWWKHYTHVMSLLHSIGIAFKPSFQSI